MLLCVERREEGVVEAAMVEKWWCCWPEREMGEMRIESFFAVRPILLLYSWVGSECGMGRDSFCGCSIPTIFNQRWLFLKRDQMKQENRASRERTHTAAAEKTAQAGHLGGGGRASSWSKFC